MSNFFKPIDNFSHVGNLSINHSRVSEIAERHRRFLKTVKEDYRSWASRVSSDNPLVSALVHMNAITEDPWRIYNLAQDQRDRVAGILKWYNGNTRGEPLSRPFFFLDNDTKEFIISVDFDTSDEVLNEATGITNGAWKEWRPIRVLNHIYSDLDYEPCCIDTIYEPRTKIRDGANIIAVDLALLYTQYRYWYDSEESMLGDTKLDASYFLLKYPLTNCIDDQMNIAYWNRLFYYARQVPIGKSKFKPIHINKQRNVSSRHYFSGTYQWVDESIIDYIVKVRKYGGMDFNRFISSIPSIDNETSIGEHYQRDMFVERTQTADIMFANLFPLYDHYLSEVYAMQWQKWNRDPIADIRKGVFQFRQNKRLSSAKPKAWANYLMDSLGYIYSLVA